MEYVLIALLLVLIVGGWFALHAALQRSVAQRHGGSIEAAMADEQEPIPSTHLIPDDETALGDTREAHDEISPHDLPKDHPGRQEAERQAGGAEGTTRGDQDRVDAAPARDERVD